MPERTCVIMQPPYLPWIGFYDLVDQADEFVFLDTVQFSKQSWQQRNKIRWKDGQHKWLTVPVHQELGQMINEVQIIQGVEYGNRHAELVRQSYGRMDLKYYKFYYERIRSVILGGATYSRLCDSTIYSVAKLGCSLGMSLRFRHPLLYRRSSQMRVEGNRSQRLVNMCKKLKCTRYLSPMGAKDYLLEDKKVFDEAGIEVVIQNYTHPEYEQAGLPFMSHLSAVDLLLNHGPNSGQIMRQGRGEPIALEAA